MKHTGNCFCGTVEIQVTGTPEAMGYCHCAGCRSSSGKPFHAFSLWKPEAVRIKAGSQHIVAPRQPDNPTRVRSSRTNTAPHRVRRPTADSTSTWSGRNPHAPSDSARREGTTRRVRRVGYPIFTPEDAVAQVRGREGGAPIAIVFGRESSGLTNPELALCSIQSTIPTATEKHSLNLAQAVQVLAYELRLALLGRADATPVTTAPTGPASASSRRSARGRFPRRGRPKHRLRECVCPSDSRRTKRPL